MDDYGSAEAPSDEYGGTDAPTDEHPARHLLTVAASSIGRLPDSGVFIDYVVDEQWLATAGDLRLAIADGAAWQALRVPARLKLAVQAVLDGTVTTPLPDGWERLHDPQYSVVYYFHNPTSFSQWTMPFGDEPPVRGHTRSPSPPPAVDAGPVPDLPRPPDVAAAPVAPPAAPEPQDPPPPRRKPKKKKKDAAPAPAPAPAQEQKTEEISTWQPLQLAPGFSATTDPSRQPPEARLVGHTVHLRGLVMCRDAAAMASVVNAFPDDFWPRDGRVLHIGVNKFEAARQSSTQALDLLGLVVDGGARQLSLCEAVAAGECFSLDGVSWRVGDEAGWRPLPLRGDFAAPPPEERADPQFRVDGDLVELRGRVCFAGDGAAYGDAPFAAVDFAPPRCFYKEVPRKTLGSMKILCAPDGMLTVRDLITGDDWLSLDGGGCVWTTSDDGWQRLDLMSAFGTVRDRETQKPQIRRFDDGVVRLRGVVAVERDAPAFAQLLRSLPADVLPAKTVLEQADAVGDAPAKLIVAPDRKHAKMQVPLQEGDSFSLDGMGWVC